MEDVSDEAINNHLRLQGIIRDFEAEPNSYLDEQGIRHAVVWDESYPVYARLEKINGYWQLVEKAPF